MPGRIFSNPLNRILPLLALAAVLAPNGVPVLAAVLALNGAPVLAAVLAPNGVPLLAPCSINQFPSGCATSSLAALTAVASPDDCAMCDAGPSTTDIFPPVPVLFINFQRVHTT